MIFTFTNYEHSGRLCRANILLLLLLFTSVHVLTCCVRVVFGVYDITQGTRAITWMDKSDVSGNYWRTGIMRFCFSDRFTVGEGDG